MFEGIKNFLKITIHILGVITLIVLLLHLPVLIAKLTGREMPEAPAWCKLFRCKCCGNCCDDDDFDYEEE